MNARRLGVLVLIGAVALLPALPALAQEPFYKGKTLRRGLAATLADPEFVAEATRIRLTIDPVAGEEVARIVAGLFDLPPAVLARMKALIAK